MSMSSLVSIDSKTSHEFLQLPPKLQQLIAVYCLHPPTHTKSVRSIIKFIFYLCHMSSLKHMFLRSSPLDNCKQLPKSPSFPLLVSFVTAIGITRWRAHSPFPYWCWFGFHSTYSPQKFKKKMKTLNKSARELHLRMPTIFPNSEICVARDNFRWLYLALLPQQWIIMTVEQSTDKTKSAFCHRRGARISNLADINRKSVLDRAAP